MALIERCFPVHTAGVANEMHARLTLNSTVTVAEFLLSALEQRRKTQ